MVKESKLIAYFGYEICQVYIIRDAIHIIKSVGKFKFKLLSESDLKYRYIIYLDLKNNQHIIYACAYTLTLVY